MTYYEDEPDYYEPTVADEILLEYTEKMKSALLDTVKSGIDELKTKNSNLMKENKILRDKLIDIESRERSLEYEKQNVMQTVRRQRLSEILADFNVILYSVERKYVPIPKCDKCNEKREITFISPSGKKMAESCECAVNKIIYAPLEEICTEFKSSSGNGNKLFAWYKVKKSSSGEDYFDYHSSSYASNFYKKGDEFKSVYEHKIFFRDAEDCQAYCDWLNNKENN